MRTRFWLLLALGLVLFPQSASSSATIRRFLLAAGANSGGPERVTLQYAVSDAEKFAEVVMNMGGVEPGDHIVLRQPDLRGFEEALEELQEKIALGRADAGRTEVLLYYSGHADEDGLLLGTERLTYGTLREKMDAVKADVRITVLDACASGAITRLKGGQRRKAFLIDASSDMQGYAFLTSSSADEAAQESDVIGASFFTHYLVSGMRGAADVSGEGKITLNEAYQFAFHETLARTTETQGGAQHPAYDINMSGTGDVVMTDVRQTSAGLLLAEELDGRFYIRNSDEQLVAELYKPAGRSVELGLEPGSYEIHLVQEPAFFLAKAQLETGERQRLLLEHFEPSERTMTVLRGSPRRIGGPMLGSRHFGGLSRRSRLEFNIGSWTRGPKDERTETFGVSTHAGSWNLLFGLGYSRWLREDLAVGIGFTVVGGEANTTVAPVVSTESLGLVSILVSMKKYLPSSTLPSAFRPYLTAGLGTYIGSVDETSTGLQVTAESRSMGALGAQLGGGVDLQIARPFMLGVKVAFNPMTDFSEPLGGRTNYSSFEFGVSISWLFGRGLRTF